MHIGAGRKTSRACAARAQCGPCWHCFAPSRGKTCCATLAQHSGGGGGVMLGVALAFAVQLINTSALDEFAHAVRAVNGQPDLEDARHAGTLPEALYGHLATHPMWRAPARLLELTALATPTAPPRGSACSPARAGGRRPAAARHGARAHARPWTVPTASRCLPRPPCSSTPQHCRRWGLPADGPSACTATLRPAAQA